MAYSQHDPHRIGNVEISIYTIDEYVWQDLSYIALLKHEPGAITLPALVGVQSHQFHRALDLAAYARCHGVQHCVIGGPHPMTSDTSMFHSRGVSFSLAEAELVWSEILADAIEEELKPVYGAERRWADHLPGIVINPPSESDLERYGAPILGLYPVRGCPYRCNFCSVIKISGRAVRNPDLDSTLESLRRANRAGIKVIKFVSDNFNKFPYVRELLNAMIDEKIDLPFYCQCDTQIAKDPELVELLGRAGCYEMFVGVESFNRKTPKAVGKYHNYPEHYEEIIRLCNAWNIRRHFSNIIGFPDDEVADVQHHLDILKELRPRIASFYILTPIPGTEQYDEFLREGLITEKNLDRFDGSCYTWTHPHLSRDRLESLLYSCYVNYYGFLLKRGGLPADGLRFAIFCRYTAAQRRHPMAGGSDPIALDNREDYKTYRKAIFDIELAPLPSSLKLSEHDEVLNRRADWRVKKPSAVQAS